MQSGNYILGNGLTIAGFNHYIKPLLEKQDVELTDYMEFIGNLFEINNEEHILISVKGTNLTNIIKESINSARKTIDDVTRQYPENQLVWGHQISSGGIPYIKELGVYSDEETASKVYQNLAVQYSLESLQSAVEEKTEEIKDMLNEFGNKFK